VLEGARQRLANQGLAERCEVAAIDFFKAVPAADTYILKWIIHDWDDDQSVTILKNCAHAMTAGGRVLIVEAVLQPGKATSFSKFMDLNMLVMTGGRERMEAEYRLLIERAGLKLNRLVPTGTEMSIIEAVHP
jgi:hypothetical protein